MFHGRACQMRERSEGGGLAKGAIRLTQVSLIVVLCRCWRPMPTPALGWLDHDESARLPRPGQSDVILKTAPPMSTSAYQHLVQRHLRMHRLGHLQSIASWDQSAFMPPKGNEARAAALAEVGGLLHEMGTAPELKTWLDQAGAEPLTEVEQASLREMRRAWDARNALPPSLVEALSLATSHCEHAWRSQRPANDWAGFLPNLKEVVRLQRDMAQRLSDAQGLSLYDALLDRYEPGMRSAEIDRVFGDLRQWLPGLIQRVMAKQADEVVLKPEGPFAKSAQRELGQAAMQLMGFDFEAGRLDESAHPFCGGVPEDVRMTTRYREDDCLPALMGVIHETGHGRY